MTPAPAGAGAGAALPGQPAHDHHVDLCWHNRVVLPDGERTWQQLAGGPLAAQLACVEGPVAILAATAQQAFAALAAGVWLALDIAIVDAARDDDVLRRELAAAGYAVVHGDGRPEPAESGASAVAGRISVFSSGTTGRPHLVHHSIHSLATMRGVGRQPARRWLVPYAPGTYAWYQCALLGLALPDQQLVPVDPTDDAWLERAREAGVDAVSATPTFWRRAFFATGPDALASLQLHQLSLGGEPVDQALLDRLHEHFPAARITHIYASSEAGACVVVSDGRAGFPAAWLDHERPNGVQLSARDGRLFVRSPWRHEQAGDDWLDTGDRVRIRDDRVEIVGRDEPTVVNVGGAKVVCDEVADVLRAHPQIAWVRVAPRRAPLVGEVVQAQLVPVAGAQLDVDALTAWCRERLPDVAVPRAFRMLDAIPTTAALKTSRGEA